MNDRDEHERGAPAAPAPGKAGGPRVDDGAKPGSEFPLPSGPPSGPQLPTGNPTPVKDLLVAAPQIELPKGGGAIRGIGEKFQANPATGTASFSVPIALSPGRGGFTPQLALSYDSGGGNSPFGHGWSVGVPKIRRKTDKGLPTYIDDPVDGTHDQDTFVFSEAEDLVVQRNADGSPDARDEDGHRVIRYRPRVEGAFARIERWVHPTAGAHWRTRGADNVVRIYGQSEFARVADPQDPRRVFEWCLEEVRDELGNVARYEYKAETRAGVDEAEPAERGHAKMGVSYLVPKRVLYGNVTPSSTAGGFLFEVVFDYGEHTTNLPTEAVAWPVRLDPFSTFRAGFDVRCYRLCKRILMFHRIPELSAQAVLVRSTELTHAESAHLTQLVSVTHRGYNLDGTNLALPPVSFTYTSSELGQAVAFVEGVPGLEGLDPTPWQWVDLDGEGISGLMTEQAGGWFYRRNEGNGQLGAIQTLPTRPYQSTGGGVRLLDVDGDGRLEVVSLTRPLAGYQARSTDGSWDPWVPFSTVPTDLDFADPNMRMLDLDGDGHADLLVTENEVFRWYPSAALDGYSAPRLTEQSGSEEDGPRLVFQSADSAIFLADMSGDGLTDLVRVRVGEVCYWPNLGHGRFGAKVVLGDSPVLDHPERFDPARVQLADIDGSGPADLIYVGPDAVRIFMNLSGNRFGPEQALTQLAGVDQARTVQVVDLLGDGTACLVWSSSLLGDRGQALRYVRLMPGGKPHLLATIVNNLGRETRLTYASSTKYYLADRAAGTPWATKLPFPVQVLESVEALDHVTGWRFTNTYHYHHGHFDPHEREFRGFGRVDQWDTESLSDFEGGTNSQLAHHVPPVCTKTWFHTWAWPGFRSLASAYGQEYWRGDTSAPAWPDPTVPSLPVEELREAHRALRGRVLRQEVYAQDGTALAGHPYTVTETTYGVRQVQPKLEQKHASFLVVDGETRTASYERNPTDPRVAHQLALVVDAYGKVRRSAAVAYPRRTGTGEQAKPHIVVSETELTHDDASTAQLHLGLPSEARSWELTGLAGDDTAPLTIDALNTAFTTAATLPFESTPTTGTQKRKLADARVLYANDALTGAMFLGTVGARALVYEKYALAMPSGLVTQVYGTTVTSGDLTAAGYVAVDGHWWVPSGRNTYDAAHFYVPLTLIDPFGQTTDLVWDPHTLAVIEVTDPLDNQVTAALDYRVLAPWRITDPNGQKTEAAFDALGRVTATAVIGKAGEGDTLAAPTVEITYDLSTVPAWTRVRAREEHANPATRWQEQVTYTDGGGNAVLVKAKVEPGLAPERDSNGDLVFVSGALQYASTTDRWVGTGRVLVDNKGNPVKQYEPFFDTGSAFTDEAELVEWGVSPVLQYDPVGRNIRTDFPDGTFTKVVFTPWEQEAWDPSDTVADSDWYDDHATERAGILTYAHRDTPMVTVLDTLGRAQLLREQISVGVFYDTTITFDVQGNPQVITDARGHATQTQTFDPLGRPLFTGSPDAGDTTVLPDVAGQPVRIWKSGGLAVTHTYDVLRRKVSTTVDEGTPRVAEQFVYGEAQPAANNLRGRLYRVYDGAGLLETPSYDFQGRPNSTTRTLLADVDTETNWAGTTALQSSGYTTSLTYDALGRVVTQTTPDGAVTTNTYNDAGLLETVAATVHGVSQTFVSGIAYDARGRRTAITYGNGTSTAYTYDPLSQRLATLVTTRASDSAQLQHLAYTYDAAGNIVQITDTAQDTLFFANAMVSPTTLYKYDALHRLVSAQGRERAGMGQTGPDDPLVGLLPDPNATVSYLETYVYDGVGNILEMKHQGGTEVNPGGGGWTRRYAYATGSNRLLSTSQPGDPVSGPYTDTYTHSVRGAMTSMPHLQWGMARDWRDQLRNVVLNTGGDDAVYHYDAGGQRVRKVVRKGAVTEERVYLGAWELYTHSGSGLVRETLHVMDGQRRIAMVETETSASTPTPRFRFQLDNHLGSAALEVDQVGALISYEEYHPYGTTSWWALATAAQVSAKRYRYTGMEQDEETKLARHGVRLYADWLGRWVSADPAGIADDADVYAYCGGRPNQLIDTDGQAGQAPGESQPVGLTFSFGAQPSVHFGVLGYPGVQLVGRATEERPPISARAELTVSIGEPAPASGGLPGPEEPLSFWSRGGGMLVGGGAMAGVGALVLLSNPVGWVALGAGLTLAGGIAGVGMGGVSLVGSYSGQFSDSEVRSLDRVGGLAMSMSGIGGLSGGVVGTLVADDPAAGLEYGAFAGGLAEAGVGLGGNLSTMAWREWQYGALSARSWSAASRRIYPLFGHANATSGGSPHFFNVPFDPDAVDMLNLSHWLGRSSWGARIGEQWVNRPWNMRVLLKTQHAMADPFAFMRLPQAHKSLIEPYRVWGLQRQMWLLPPWLRDSAFYGVRGAEQLAGPEE